MAVLHLLMLVVAPAMVLGAMSVAALVLKTTKALKQMMLSLSLTRR